MQSSSRFSGVFCLLLSFGLLLRGGVMVWRADELRTDPDAYVGLAVSLHEGNGFATPGTESPTAFRPPLYPLLLSICGAGQPWGVVLLHLLCGAGTIAAAWRLAGIFGSREVTILSTALVAADPLLLRYAPLPMTETLSALLITWLMVLLISPRAEAHGSSRSRIWAAVFVGVLWSLNGLCRPTIWAFAGLWGVWGLFLLAYRQIGGRKEGGLTWPWTSRRDFAVMAVVCLLTIAPWMIRNQRIFGKPIFATTHGGYTLLLGNNPVFYREVVAASKRVVWHEASLAAWQAELERDMQAADPPVSGEIERDRWMYRRARRTIAESPELFVRACLLRLRRFWGVFPTASASRLESWCIGLFYGGVLLGVLLSIFCRAPGRGSALQCLFLLLAAFSLVHLFYWTNMRMRAPLSPVLAVLAAQGYWQAFRARGSRAACKTFKR